MRQAFLALLAPVFLAACIVQTDSVEGEIGQPGPQGPKGDTGPHGETGSQGLKGDTGSTGMTGATGLQGPSGPAGVSPFAGPDANGNIYYTGGKVGIGTTSPIQPFDIRGDGADGSYEPLMSIANSNGNMGGTLGTRNASADGRQGLKISGAVSLTLHAGQDDIDFQTGTVADEHADTNTVMKIQNDGNVGIGTNAPKSKLSVNGSISAAEDVYISDFTRGVILRAPGGACFRLKVNDAGNVITEQAGCPQQ